LPEHISNKLDIYTHKELVNILTPLGMLWLFLDDGCLFWKDTKSITICQGIEKDLHQDITEYLSTYNIHSIAYNKTCTIAQQVEIVKFINTFIKPYIDIIPPSMRYKTEIMI
jgi:predicted flavoprotein YhiN